LVIYLAVVAWFLSLFFFLFSLSQNPVLTDKEWVRESETREGTNKDCSARMRM